MQAGKLTILSVWIYMAKMCSSPFDDNSHFDIDLLAELDRNIWAASVSLDPKNIRNIQTSRPGRQRPGFESIPLN